MPIPVSIARKRSPGTDTQQSYMLWINGNGWRHRAGLVRRVGDNAIVLNHDGIDFVAMESEHAKQPQAIIVPGDGAGG